MSEGKLYEKALRGTSLCQAHIGWTVETCPERRRHGCGGDGDSDNCYSRRYVRTSQLDEAKAEYLAISKEADDDIDKAKAEGDVDSDWIKERYEVRDDELWRWFQKWFGTSELKTEG